MKNLECSDEYRTNPMSLQPGGVTVRVLLENGQIISYDKVKKPWHYVKTIISAVEGGTDKFNSAVLHIETDEKVYWRNKNAGGESKTSGKDDNLPF
jgi:hypothetical protein